MKPICAGKQQTAVSQAFACLILAHKNLRVTEAPNVTEHIACGVQLSSLMQAVRIGMALDLIIIKAQNVTKPIASGVQLSALTQAVQIGRALNVRVT